jgi:hypothetical protein
MARASRTSLLAIAASFALWSGPALAADPKLQGVGQASVGVTDNIQSAPEQPLPGQASRSAGAFTLLSPGLVLALATTRAVHRWDYTYGFELLFANTSASTSSNQLGYHSFFDLSPRTSLVLGANAVQTNRYSAFIFTPPGYGAVGAVPTGSGSFLSTSADELLSYEITFGWRAYQGATGVVQTPLFETVAPRTFSPVARLWLSGGWATIASC